MAIVLFLALFSLSLFHSIYFPLERAAIVNGEEKAVVIEICLKIWWRRKYWMEHAGKFEKASEFQSKWIIHLITRRIAISMASITSQWFSVSREREKEKCSNMIN